MNNTHFNQIKYNQTIIERQKELLSELCCHGELESYRNEIMSELQNLALNIIDKNEDITLEQLVEIMSDIIKNPIASKEEIEIISQRKKEMDDERNRLFEAAERPSTEIKLKIMKKTLKRNKKN